MTHRDLPVCPPSLGCSPYIHKGFMTFSASAKTKICDLPVFTDVLSITTLINRAATAERRDGTADMLAESHQ